MRTVFSFNDKWAFTKQCNAVPTQLPMDWNWVNLPHCWNNIDGQDGGSDYWRGTAYYAKSFGKADLPAAERYFIEFRGTNSSADFYLNGKHLAHHDGGYSTWRVDITHALEWDNLFVVAVDNSPNEEVYPQMADFTFYGGIYRDVNIICVSESHFDLEYYGAPGIKVTPVVSGTDGNLEVEVFVKNMREGQKLIYTLYDAEEQALQTVETTDTKVNFHVADVHLWHGRRDPYLYCCEAELVEDGEVKDNVCTRLGFRYFEIHPENGFLLNGEEYPLRGVSRHQDRWGKGNALSKEDHKQDMELICEVGANTIRLAHYQHDSYFYDLCDEYGQVVWAEIPFISGFMEGGVENTVSQMKELIAQNYNHPSIVVWGLSNEITIGGSTPELLDNHKRLNDLCHQWDKTRLTTVAVVSPCPPDDPYLLIPDVVSYNHYFGWYGGDTSMNGPWFDHFHEIHPDLPIGCSEYGCEALNWHSSDPVQGDYTEEYQAYYHEELIKQLFTRKYLWATHVWNMFDFGADSRGEGGENGQNHKGLVTFDRSYKKDSFYAYKAWLSPEPFVHICGKRYTDRVEDVTKVTVYSNQPEVELFANGVSLGRQASPEHFFYFDVPNVGEQVLRAVAGDCTDESFLRKVDVFNEAYRLVEKGAVLNWFDITMPEGCFSINDKISDIMMTPEGKQLMGGFMAQLTPSAGEGNEAGKNDGAGFAMELKPDSPMMAMLGGFTVLRLTGMLGGFLVRDFTKEELLDLNAMLNQIKKPE